MSSAQHSQHAIRRSTRLPLEVPIRVTSVDPARPLVEECTTTLVNAHGCGLIARQEIPRGIQVQVEIVTVRRQTSAVVSEVVPLGGDPETWLIGLELDTPGNFWGIEYAPSDWKVDSVPGPAAEPLPTPEQTQKPEGIEKPEKTEPAEQPEKTGRRWRLTDISTGACYLETVHPFDAGTPVLLSVRASNAECLLDGIVRTSHAQAGIGVEFTDPEQKTKIAELIQRLTETREVPRIFVGKKEGRQKEEALRHLQQQPDQDVPDPLLELVREGPALSADQFLSDLKAQRLGKRRDTRASIAIVLRLSGTDQKGKALDQEVDSINVSPRGLQLAGIHERLGAGAHLEIISGSRREPVRVSWVGAPGSPVEGQIGVTLVDPASNFCEEILQASPASGK